MRWIGWYCGVPVAAIVGGVCGVASLAVLGLVWSLAVPVAVFFGLLYAALGALWVGNLAAVDGSRGRLGLVLAVSGLSGVISFVVVFAGAAWFTLPVSLIALLGAVFVGVVVAVSVAVWRFRAPRGRLRWRGSVALVVAGVWAVALFLVSPGVPWGPSLREAVLGPYWASGAGGATELAVAVSLVVAVAGIIWAVRRTVSGISGYEIERDAALTLSLVALSMPVFILMLRLFPTEGP